MTINNTEESPYNSYTSHGSEILYVLTVEDLEGCYNDAENRVGRPDNFEDLPLEERQGVIRAVKKYLESWAGDSVYNWNDAIEDGIESYYMYTARYEGGSDAKVQS